MSLAPPGVGDINDFNNMSANIGIPQDFVNNSSGNLTSGSNEKDLCNSISIKSYFEKILELSRIGDEFPVNLNDVWPLAYSRKDVAVRSLVDDKNFIQDIDYQVFHQNVENLNGGRPVTVYMISVSCMEYLVARKVREVFNVYREVFHKAAKKVPSTYAEALRMYADEVEAKEKAEKEARFQQPQMGQMGQYQQLQDRVIDLTVEINGSSMTYVVPESRDVAMSNNITLACSVDPIMNQLNAAKRTSSDILDSIDKHRRTLEACDSILEEINPAFKQTKDQDRKIKNLEEKVDRMGSSFDELKELLIKKLG